jgi:hypothetical protein
MSFDEWMQQPFTRETRGQAMVLIAAWFLSVGMGPHQIQGVLRNACDAAYLMGNCTIEEFVNIVATQQGGKIKWQS